MEDLMRARTLDKAWNSETRGQGPSHCQNCPRRSLCHHIGQVIDALRLHERELTDIEYRIRLHALLKKLTALGFDYPEGMVRCAVSELQRPEMMRLLREAQILLLEILSAG